MKKQVVMIHGGETFEDYDAYLSFLKGYQFDFSNLKKKGWKDSLQEKLGEDFEVIAPKMPCKENAKCAEWSIWFEKFFPLFRDGVVLVGHSLGGIFLAKYLSEQTFPVKIAATLLVSAPFDADEAGYSLADFILPADLSRFERQGGTILLYHSKDDFVVPFADAEKYAQALPAAAMHASEDRGHFLQEDFPELVAAIWQATS